jgi:hypothetical protein
MDIREGNQEEAPNVDNEGRDCFVNTMPTMKPVNDTSGNDLYPTW